MKKAAITFAMTLVVTFCFCQGNEKEDKKKNNDTVVNLNIKMLKDARDGKNYKTIKIGTQMWFAENLNFYTGAGSWCYNNDVSQCELYGRLYDWETARRSCPKGWHLPTDADWNNLIAYIGKEEGAKLKSVKGWNSGLDGKDSVGFTALPGGYRSFNDLTFNYAGAYGFWWSLDDASAFGAWSQYLCYDQVFMYRLSNNKKDGFSVRCIKNN